MANGTVCTIDTDGVLIGKRSVDVAVLDSYRPKENEVVFRHEVDLEENKYRFVGTAFFPIRSDVENRIQSQPDLLRGLIALAKAIRDQGILDPFPNDVAKAIDWYGKTVDGSSLKDFE